MSVYKFGDSILKQIGLYQSHEREVAISKLRHLKYFPAYEKFPIFDDYYECLFADKDNPTLIVDIAKLIPIQFYTGEVEKKDYLCIGLNTSITHEMYEIQDYWNHFFLRNVLLEFRHMISNKLQETLIPIPKMTVYMEPYIQLRITKEDYYLSFNLTHRFFVIS